MTERTGTTSGGRVELASDLAGGVLLLLLRLDPLMADGADRRLELESGGTATEVEARWLPLSLADDDSAAPALCLVSAKLPPSIAMEDVRAAGVRVGGETNWLAPESLRDVLASPSELLAEQRDVLNASARANLQRFVVAIPTEHSLALDPTLASNLNLIRDQMRSRLPGTDAKPGPLAARLETVVRLDERAYWLTGWVHHAQPLQTSFTAVSPEGERVVLPEGAVSFHPRPGAAEKLEDDEHASTLGFQAYVELKHPSRAELGWLVEFEMADGQRVEHETSQPVSGDIEAPFTLVRDLLKSDAVPEPVLENQILPYLARRHSADAVVEEVIDYGSVIPAPEVSLLISLREPGPVEHQLAQFARDPELAGVELIFVAWPSAKAPDVTEVLRDLHELYGLPFRLVMLSRSTSRRRALNLAATVAGGPLLLLMSTEVLPAQPGWIGRLRAFLDNSATVAAVGPKLLHEDDSIARAGVVYTRRRGRGGWQPTFPYAGLSRTVEAANAPRQVDAVSDACLLIEATRFRDAGGLNEVYLGEGDEGADLCLRLRRAGAEVWYCPASELYLLASHTAAPLPERFNNWLFGHRWSSLLEELTEAGASQDGAGSAGAVALPSIPRTGSGRAGPPIESLEVIPAEAGDGPLLDFGLELPRPSGPRQHVVYDDTYSFAITGWALARGPGAVTIQLQGTAREVRQMNAKLPSPKLAEKFPDAPGADNAAFQFVVGSLGLPPAFEVEVIAVTKDGERTRLGTVRGQRRQIRSAYRPLVQPLLVTMTGRSGSNWLITLLGSHPEIMTYKPFVYEPMLASYWMAVLRTLADPMSYMQSLQPELYEHDWWTGNGRKSPLPLQKPTAEMAQWLGSENVEVMAGFCQSRLDAFYTEFARVEGRQPPRYFVEKCIPGTARGIGELYPDGREIVLVRDFRDRVCSIIDYNAKRGHQLWGRDRASTDEEWFAHLREEARNLLENWRERRDRAHLVRYEDLVLEPEATLGSMFDYLEVDHHEATIRGTIDRASDTLPQAQEKHRTATSVEASVGRWRRDLSPDQQAGCALAFDDILVEFGYEPSSVGSEGSASARGDATTTSA